MNAKHVSRRQFLSMCGLTATSAVVAACAPQASPTSAAAGNPTAAVPTAAPEAAAPAGAVIRYWVAWGGAPYGNAWKAIQENDDFKEALGDNTFELKDSTSDESLLTAVAGGDPPEGASNVEYLDFMARDVLLPIDDLVAASTVIKKDDFLTGAWETASYRGVTYGVPSTEGFMPFGVYYNSELVQEAGLDPQKPPVTWDEFLDWHQKLTKKDNAGNVTRIGLNPYGAMGEGLWYAGGFMASISWGWNWFDDASHTFDFNNDKMVEAFTTFKEFVDVVGVDNLTAVYSVEGHDDWGGAYDAETECMIIQGYWMPGETMNKQPDVAKVSTATWLPVPESRRGTKTQGTYTHMVILMKASKNPQVMYKIAEVLTQKPACDALFKNVGWLPPIKAYINSVDPSTYPGLDFYIKSATEATEWHNPAHCEITRFANTQYGTLKDKVNRGEMTPAQAAEELQNACTQEYKNQGFAS